jgi:hypothetical protein
MAQIFPAWRPIPNCGQFGLLGSEVKNLQNAAAAHQHAFWIEIGPGANAFARSETYVENGEAGSETATFTRIPQPTSNP